MFYRRMTYPGMALATALGVAGGVYIYRPIFEPPKKKTTRSSINQDDAIVVQGGEKMDSNKTEKATWD